MNRLCKILCILLLVRLLLPVVGSVAFQRQETEKPVFSVSAVLDGSFYDRLDENFQKSYPFRDRIAETFLNFEEFFGLSRD